MKRRSFFGTAAALFLPASAVAKPPPAEPSEPQLLRVSRWKFEEVNEVSMFRDSGIDLCVAAVADARDRFFRAHQVFPDALFVARDGHYTWAAEVLKTMLDDFGISLKLGEDAALGSRRAWYLAKASRLDLRPCGSGGLGYVCCRMGR